MLFWTLAIAMLAGAVALLAPTLLRRSHNVGVASGELNLTLHRQRLAELTAERDAGVIAPEAFDQARGELEQVLLQDVPTADTLRPSSNQVPAWRTLLLIAIALPLIAAGVYWQLGTHQLATLAAVESPASDPASNAQHTMNEMVAGLAARLETQPDDVEGWVMLGRSYLAMRQPGQAVTAFDRAHRLVGDEPRLLVDYAEALAMANDNDLEGEPLQLITRALAIDPNNQKALWFEGLAARNRGDGAGAVQSWRRLTQLLPPGSEELQRLQQFIADTEGVSAAGTVDSAAQPITESPATTGIDVSVTLTPELASRIDPGAILFVFARAVEGPRIPLAIIRGSAQALPLTVTLDDNQAMSPTLTLSKFSEVVVSARVSNSGSATPQSGDLLGQSAPLQLGNQKTNVAITINQVID